MKSMHIAISPTELSETYYQVQGLTFSIIWDLNILGRIGGAHGGTVDGRKIAFMSIFLLYNFCFHYELPSTCPKQPGKDCYSKQNRLFANWDEFFQVTSAYK